MAQDDRIDIIVWDVGGVIDPHNPLTYRLVKQNIAQAMLEYNPEKYNSLDDALARYELEFGETHLARLTADRLIKESGINQQQSPFIGCINAVIPHLRLERDQTLIDFLKSAKDNGKKHYILTNGPLEYTLAVLDQTVGSAEYFEEIYTIEDLIAIGIEGKPDPAAFEYAKLKIAERESDPGLLTHPGRMLYIGDETKDMVALVAKMQAFLFNPGNKADSYNELYQLLKIPRTTGRS